MMVELKFWIIPIAALIPLIEGFIWYNPKVMGTAWMKEAGMTEEKAKEANMPLMFGLSYVFANLIGFALIGMTIHQFGFQSMVLTFMETGDEATKSEILAFFAKFGGDFRTFGHGALHGGMAGVTLAFTVLATNSMFDGRSWKYIWINAGYWIVSLSLMGGVICQFA